MSTHRAHNLLRLCAVLAAFLVFAFLLTFRLGEREMALDETITVGHTETAQSVYDAFHPMGYYWLLYHWRQVWGGRDGALRAFSVLWALAAAGLVWLLARALLPPGEDALALWLFVVSPFSLLYLRLARYFSLTMTVALAVAYFALLARREGKLVHYLGLGLAAAGLLWTNYVPCLLLPLVYLWLLPTAWRRGRQRWGWALAAALPLATVAPKLSWLLFSVRSVAETSVGHPPAALPAVALKLLLPFYAALVGETTDFWRFSLTVPVALAGMALWVAGLVEVWRRRQPERWLLLLPWPLTVVGVTVVLSTAAASEPWPRVTSLSLFALPFFLMTVAAGFSRFAGEGRARTRPLPRRGAAVATALLALLLGAQVYGVYNYQARRQFLNPGYNLPWREVSATLQAQGKPGEVAVAWWDGTVQRYGTGPVRFVNLVDETLTWQKLPPEVADFPRAGTGVWVIARDRGSDLAVSLTDHLIGQLADCAATHTVYPMMPLSPQERYWRERLGGRPVGASYLTLHHFSGIDKR
jgi:4-amino-4-deoxy-L-arabinose transferase-like glycosyltransferase